MDEAVVSSGVSVCAIVPVYNVEAYLGRCVESLFHQTDPFDQVILVDDGSTDGSGAMCDELSAKDARFTVVHKENGGLSSARNVGMKQNWCTHVTFVDSDDWIAPTFVEVMRRLVNATGCDVAMCGSRRVRSYEDFEGKRSDQAVVTTYSAEEWMRLLLRFEGNRALHYAWGKLYRVACLGSDPFPVGMLNEDVEGSFKVALNVRLVTETTDPLYAYFVNDAGITGKGFGENYLCLSEVWARVADIARAERPDVLAMVEYNVKRANFTVLCDALIHGNSDTDREYAPQLSEHRRLLRRCLPALLAGPMDARRKLAAVALAFIWRPARFVYRLVKR